MKEDKGRRIIFNGAWFTIVILINLYAFGVIKPKPPFSAFEVINSLALFMIMMMIYFITDKYLSQ